MCVLEGTRGRVREWAIGMDALTGKIDTDWLSDRLDARQRATNRGRWALLFLMVLFPWLARGAGSLPILHTVRQAHVLSASEAVRGYPVHLERAQVTYYDPTIFCLFIMDSTDGIFVDFRDQSVPQIRSGDIVTVDAVSGPGKVNAVLLHPRFHVLRHSPLPDAPQVSFDRILSGAWDSRWISLEGVVRSVRRPSEITAYAGEPGFGSSNIIVTLSSGPDLVDVITSATGAVDSGSLVDARVRLRVAVGSRFNQRLQLIGVHVYANNLSDIEILERPPANPFSLPVTETAGVMRRSLFAPGHRVSRTLPRPVRSWRRRLPAAMSASTTRPWAKAFIRRRSWACVGIIEDVHKAIGPDFREAGRTLIVLRGSEPGDASDVEAEFGSSEYAKEILGQFWGFPPSLELDREAALQKGIIEMIDQGLVESAKDCSEGGVAVTLAECGFARGIGAKVDLSSDGLVPEFVLFGEDASRILISCDPTNVGRIKEIAVKYALSAEVIGETVQDKLKIWVAGVLAADAELSELRDAWAGALKKALHVETEDRLVPGTLQKS